MESSPIHTGAPHAGNPEDKPGGVTARSVGIGLLMVVFVNFWILYSLYLIRASWLQVTHFPMGLFVPFMLLALFANPALKALRRGRGLSRSEILVVAAMGLTGAMVPGFSLMTTLLGTISVPYYMATPENQWSAFFHLHMPDWIAPSNRGGTMRMLFEGLPSRDTPIPLGAWAGPLTWWMALVGAFAFASMCLMVILRRQWVEYERLVYPLAQVAADMAGDERDGRSLPGFMRTRAFKFGFGAATLVMTWNMMSHFAPWFPEIPLGIPSRWTTFFKGFPPLHTTINFYTIGFAYLANLDVLFSIWFFHFMGMWEVFVFGRLGVGGISGGAAVSWQSIGALCTLVVWGLWTARKHLRQVLRGALHPGADDAEEILSYRTAACGAALSLIFIVAWFYNAGMGMLLSAVLVLLFFVTYLGIARVVAQSGLLYVSSPMFPQTAILRAVGPAAIPGRAMTALAFSFALRNDGRGLFMPALAHVAKIGDLIGGDRRRLGYAVALGLGGAVATSVGLTLYWGYTIGAYNFGSIALLRRTVPTFNWFAGMMSSPDPVKPEVFGYFGAGCAAMLALTFLRYRLPWWPLHPLGLAVTWSGMTVHSVLSVFLAWAVKGIVLKAGGVFLYRRSIPFFLGLMVGYALNVGVSFVLDITYFGGEGHGVHAY